MRSSLRRLLVFLSVLTLGVAFLPGPSSVAAGPAFRQVSEEARFRNLQDAAAQGAVAPLVLRDLLRDGTAEGFLMLAGDAALAGALASAPQGAGMSKAVLRATKPAYAAQKGRVLGRLSGITVLRDYDALPILFVRFDSQAAALQAVNDPEVKGIGGNERRRTSLAQSLPLIGQPIAAAAGDTGAGTSVAVLDTGVDYTRSAFGSCTSPGVPAGCKVAYAHDFAPDDGSLDDNGHGTNVAGIVVGVAPSTQILALDVFAGSTAWDDDIVAAINWAISNQSTYDTRAMNLSLGDGSAHTAACSEVGNPYVSAFANARTVGIMPVVAAGNDATPNGTFRNGISSPACTPGALSVGAVYDSNVGAGWVWGTPPDTCTDATTAADQITCFSQSASILTVLAPGAMIVAAGRTMGGTSQASPHVAGAVALLAAVNPSASLDVISSAIAGSGPTILDARNGVTSHRLYLPDAIAAVGTPTSGLQFSSSAYSVDESAGSVTITVTRGGDTSAAVTVDYATSDVTATAGADYTAASGTLPFGSGETSKTFAVSITADSVTEGNETVNLTLGNPTGGASLGTPSTAVLTIVEQAGIAVTVTGRLRGYLWTSGRYAIYPVGKNVLYVGKVVPNLAGSSLHFVLQSHPRRRWKTTSAADFAMGSDGTVTVRVRHRNLRVGLPYRLQCSFAGDATHLSGTSAWSYFRVVR
jgi:subtilisin family serine protease